MRKAIKKVGHWIGTACTFLLLANLKAVAATLGLDRLAANHTFLGALASAITSPAARTVALVGFGIALWTAFDWIARWWDARHPSLDQRLCDTWPELADISDLVGHELQAGQAIPSMGLASRVAAKYVTLGKFGMPCPMLPPATNGRYWFAVNKMFLDQLAPLLREGHASDARTLASQYVASVNGTTTEQREQVQRQLDHQFGHTL